MWEQPATAEQTIFSVTNHFGGHLRIRPLTLTRKPGIIGAHNNEQVHLHPVCRDGSRMLLRIPNSSFRGQARIWVRASVNFARRESIEGAQVEVNR
jgi:hypothetical protein